MPSLWRVVPALVLLVATVPLWLWQDGPAPVGAAPAAQASQVGVAPPVQSSPTPAVVPPSLRQATATPTTGPTAGPTSPAATPTAPSLGPAPPGRYFPESGYAIRDDAFWGFFQGYGGVRTFGYPISRQFQFLGFQVQFFQRQIMQKWADGSVHTLNLLDPELMPYTRINGSVFPDVDQALKDRTPSVGTPTYATDIVRFVQQNAPDQWNNLPVNYWQTFRTTVPGSEGDALFNLDIWGAPISQPAYDPSNQSFVYGRWQRGIMHFDVGCNCTQGLLLADWFKTILTGQGLPGDLAGQAQNSRYLRQYNNAQPAGLNRPGELPGSDMRFAFEREQP
jgi:hypothetical protein